MKSSTASRVGLRNGRLALLSSTLLIAACHKTAATPLVCIPRVQIVEVEQRDVPLYREWSGTLDGSQVDLINVQFNISEMEYLGSANGNHWAEPGGSGDPPLELILEDGTVHPYRGAVIAIDRQINSQTGTIALIGSFPNPASVLRPGQYARIRAAVVIRQNAILVPQRAVNEIQGSYQVAVVGADGKVQIRSVATAEQIGTSLIITQGVRAGEKVIVSDLARLAPGMAVRPVLAPDSFGASPEAAPACLGFR
jgi:membrane fusion protein (multidrug efflux system)